MAVADSNRLQGAPSSPAQNSSTRPGEGVVSDPDSRPPNAPPAATTTEHASGKVRDVLTRSVEVLHPDNTLEEAAKKMQQAGVGSTPVCIGDNVIGLITDRDIIERSVARGEDPSQDRVRDVMTTEVTCCFEDQDIAEAQRVMHEKHVHQLPVLDHDNHLVGIVTPGDLAGKHMHSAEIGR
jgi:CBS domain-containing protein